ncbi:MAG: calcium-binding protein [Caldisericaceae bacterium]|nr:calcium-binding protein [Caldisericaceae bacterium]
MERIPEDSDREYRIHDEAVVDAYGEEERAMGWDYYMDDKLHRPFKAKCIAKRRISPLQEGEEVEIQGMAPEDECMKEIFIEINWQGRQLAVPLSQIEAIEEVEEETQEAIEDWHYWAARGYQY